MHPIYDKNVVLQTLHSEGTGTVYKNVSKATRWCGTRESQAEIGVVMERSGLMSSERTEQERDGGLKAHGETAAGLWGGRWQQCCGKHCILVSYSR
jgi:hypothetical protein